MTLYIIGNGFDLKHDIPTRYSDFAKFVANSNIVLFKQIESCLCNLSPNGLWSNFEEALGTQNIEELNKYYNRNIKENRDNPIGINDSALKSAFHDWIISLKRYILHCVHVPRIAFVENACFLSFNYTNTLEDVYGISPHKIYHIHGYVDSKDKEQENLYVGYIYGHGREKSSLTEYEEFEIKETINFFKKDYQTGKLSKLCENKWFSDIIILGHSIGLVDASYFNFLNKKYTDAKWHIGYFNDADLINKIKRCDILKIRNPHFFIDQ